MTSRSKLNLYIARGGGQIATWLDTKSPLGPQFGLKRLAGMYSRTVSKPGVVFDIVEDDANRHWFLMGGIRPALDGARRDDEFFAGLIVWEEIMHHWPLDHSCLVAWVQQAWGLAEDCRTSADLAALKVQLPNRMQLNPDVQRQIIRQHTHQGLRPLFERIATGQRVQLSWPEFSWPVFSTVASMFPLGFAASLGISVTDAAVAPSSTRINISTIADPFSENCLRMRGQNLPEIRLTAGDHNFVEWFINQESREQSESNPDVWQSVRSECDKLFPSGWSQLWPRSAGEDLLHLMGILATGNNSRFSDDVWEQHCVLQIHEVVSKHRNVPYCQSIIESLQVPPCEELIRQIVAGEELSLLKLSPLIAADPAVRTLYSLWMDDLQSVHSGGIDAIESAVAAPLRCGLVANGFSRLFRPGIPLHWRFRFAVWLISETSLDSQTADQRIEILQLLIAAHDHRIAESADYLLHTLLTWPEEWSNGKSNPLVQQMEMGRSDLLYRCALILAEIPSETRSLLIQRFEELDPRLPAMLVAAADLQDVDLTHDLPAAMAIPWSRRIAELVVGRLAAFCRLEPSESTGKSVCDPLHQLRVEASMIFGIKPAPRIFSRLRSGASETPMDLAHHVFTGLLANPRSWRRDSVDRDVHSWFLSAPQSNDFQWTSARSVAREYLYGYEIDNPHLQKRLHSVFVGISQQHFAPWVQSAEEFAKLWLKNDSHNPESASMYLASRCLELGHITREITT